jgi:hypothetical protein
LQSESASFETGSWVDSTESGSFCHITLEYPAYINCSLAMALGGPVMSGSALTAHTRPSQKYWKVEIGPPTSGSIVLIT